MASKAIDKALSLNANNARALAIKDLIVRDQKTVSMDGLELDVASNEPITLSFKDANIKEVFGILTQLSGINFIFDEEIRSQSISVLLEKASFAQAMELILQMNGLEKKILNGKTVIIFPQSREKEKQYGDQIIQTFYLSHIDAKKAVNLLRTMLQLRKVYVHEERNALVVRDKPEVIKLAEQILDAADRGNSEVVFDLELVEITQDDTLNIGPKLTPSQVSFGLANTDGTSIVSSALAAGTDVANLVSGLNGLNSLDSFYTVPTASFDFAKTLKDSEILANPKIRVKNKGKAKVHIGSREPVLTVTINGDQTSESVQYVDVGVKLDIEPQIQLDGSVETKLKLEVSSVIAREKSTETGTTILTIGTTNTETDLILMDGEQTIIGGLLKEEDSKSRTTFPFLGDIPLIGHLFSNHSNTKQKRETLLSITPHIVKQIEIPGIDVATIWSGGEDNLKNGPNFGAFARPLISEVDSVRPQAAPAVEPLKVQVEASSGVLDVDAQKPDEVSPAKEALLPKVELDAKPVVPELGIVAPDVAFPAEETRSSPEELVPTEVLPEQQEVGAPIVLEMPKKGPVTLLFETPENVEKDQEFTVSVSIQDVDNLYSAPLFVKYDPAVLELINLSEGSFLKQEGQSTVFSSSPNRTTGQVIVGYKQGTGGKGATGSGKLFDLNFKALTEGETSLEVNRINFRNPEGVRLKVVSEPVMIEVR